MIVPETSTILVVDDSPVNLQVLVRTLQASGHRILAARNGKTALEIAEHALERLLHLIAFLAVDKAQSDWAAACAAEDDAVRLLAELAPGRVEREAIFARQRPKHLHVIGRGRLALRPGHDRAAAQERDPSLQPTDAP